MPTITLEIPLIKQPNPIMHSHHAANSTDTLGLQNTQLALPLSPAAFSCCHWVTSHRPKPILNLSYSIVPEIGPLIGLFDYPKSVSEILQDNL